MTAHRPANRMVGAFRSLPLRRQLALLIALCAGLTALLCMAAVVGGREVSAVVRDGRIEVRATLVAVDSGTIGDVVRVTHSETRRVMRARVIGRAEVEIRHEP